MNSISMHNDSDLAKALRSYDKTIHLVAKDSDGTVLASYVVQSWVMNSRETEVVLKPLAERIDEVADHHAQIQRIQLSGEARERGLL